MSEIKPALTRNEWAAWNEEGFHGASGATRNEDGSISFGSVVILPEVFDALAVILLGGRFAWEDVEMLRNPTLSPDGQEPERDDLATRLEALLPPEDP